MAGLKALWGRFTAPQRWLFIGGAVVVLFSVGTALYLNRDTYVVLASNLAPADASAIVARLNELKVPYKPNGDTTITVPKSEEFTAKLAMAESGLPKGGAGPGMELFDNPSITQTDFDKRVNYVRAQTGELEKALMRLDPVEYANVKLTLPDPSPFIRDQRKPTASVLVQTKAGRSLSKQQIDGVVAFVTGAVEGLTADNVSVIDNTGRTLYQHGAQQGLDTDAAKLQAAKETAMEDKLRNLLEPVFGAGEVVSQVNIEYNLDSSQTQTTTLGSPVKLTDEWTRQNQTGTQGATTPQNTTGTNQTPSYPATTPAATPDSSAASGKTTYATGQTVQTTTSPAGSIKRVTASVTVNRASLSAAEMNNVKAVVAQATGANVADIAVLAMPFSRQAPTTQLPQQTPLLQPRTLTISLGVVAAVMLLLLFLGFRRKDQTDFDDLPLQPMPQGLPLAQLAGTSLDVALGGDRGLPLGDMNPDAVMAYGPNGRPGGSDAAAAGEGGGTSSVQEASNTAAQRLEVAMKARPKRQLVIGNTEVPTEFLLILEDLSVNSPEACTSVLRDWLKGVEQGPNDKRTSKQKAALFCVNLGAELSAAMIQHLTDEEIELLTVEIARSEKITAEERDDLFQEFIELSTAERYIHSGGIDYARNLLAKALGERRANDILQRLTSHLRKRPFDSVRRTDPQQLAGFLQGEHPQTIAVVLAHLAPDQAALVVAGLPQEKQADIIKRIATLDPTSPEMLREAERVLERKMTSLMAQESSTAGGLSWVVDVLNRVDRGTERTIMGQLSTEDPELANEIAQKMFLFEDIVRLDDLTVQRILRDVDMTKDLPMALKAAKDEVWRKITANVSRRTADALKESVELLGPIRIRDVEEAQARIVALIRKLDEMGEIQMTRGGAEDEFI